MSLRYAVLGLLAEHRGASGYDLRKLFESSLANVWTAPQSQLYTELSKLSSDGLIEITGKGARGRKHYQITSAGLAELQRWITNAAARPTLRDETMLRALFLGRIKSEESERFLNDYAESLRLQSDELDWLLDRFARSSDDQSVYGRIVAEYNRRLLAMQREWLEIPRELYRAAASKPDVPADSV
ncbi:PadR family transcriptional regulator [Nocardia tengchongensis]|uniref:PadR family transcriptional regulator n=1 Tax=Nocardia tengchongensis TaxID=2055889 RepID=UPI0036A80F92